MIEDPVLKNKSEMKKDLFTWLDRNLKSSDGVVFGTIATGKPFRVRWNGESISFIDRNIAIAYPDRIQAVFNRCVELPVESRWITTRYGNNWEECPNLRQCPYVGRIVLAFLYGQNSDEFRNGRNSVKI